MNETQAATLSSPARGPGRRFRLYLLTAAALLVGLLCLAWLFPNQVLCLDSGDVKADAIVLLGGGSYERPARAAELFLSGAAPLLIVTGLGDCTNNQRLLIKAGVPPAAILLEPDARTTRENALRSIPLLRTAHAKNVILVTSWYHSRRSLKCFRHYAPDLQFYVRPAYFGFERSRWSRDGLSRQIRAEYFKIIGYWLCYGVCPF